MSVETPGYASNLVRLLHQRYRDMGDTLARQAAWEIERLTITRPEELRAEPSKDDRLIELADVLRNLAVFAKDMTDADIGRCADAAAILDGKATQSPHASAEAPKGLPPYPLAHVAGCKWPACDCPGRWDCKAKKP